MSFDTIITGLFTLAVTYLAYCLRENTRTGRTRSGKDRAAGAATGRDRRMNARTKWEDETQDYRRGYVEAFDGLGRDSYLLETGATELSEYERGFFDGREDGLNRDALTP